MDLDLARKIEELSKNTPPVPRKGEIYTLGTFERALRNLQHPFSREHIPEPSPEELRQAVQTVQKVYGKRILLRTPEGNLEGILRPSGGLGVYFTHYEGSQPARHLFSHEYLKLERKEPMYEFSAASLGGCFPCYGLERLQTRYQLWRAGIRPKTEGK